MDGSQFTAEEWRSLRLAPFWVLSSVAGRYRYFDKADRNVFADAVARAQAVASEPVSSAVLGAFAAEPDRLWGEFEADQRSAATGLYDVAKLLDRVRPDVAEAFRDVLVGTIGVPSRPRADPMAGPRPWWICNGSGL